MIDFKSIRKKLNNITKPIGGEFYVSLRSHTDINVYNEWDQTSNTLITDKKKLLLYQTDRSFDVNSMYLLQNYNKIYSVNNKIVGNDRIISIPLGMVDTGRDISFAICNKHHEFSVFDLIKECGNSYNSYPEKLLYMNFRIYNNTQTDRINSIKIKSGLSESQYTDEIYYGQNWLLFDTQENLRNFYNKCLNHIFISCPEGLGIDTYRFYEMLYLGRIPVVLHNPVTDMFGDLPILFLNKWDDFKDEYQKFIDNFDINNYNFEKLTTDFWYNIFVK